MIPTRENFDAFLREWTADRIGPLGDRCDPTDREFIVRRRASELKELARDAACLSALVEATRRYGGVIEYVEAMFKRADDRARDL
jgi:hypothetical protein